MFILSIEDHTILLDHPLCLKRQIDRSIDDFPYEEILDSSRKDELDLLDTVLLSNSYSVLGLFKIFNQIPEDTDLFCTLPTRDFARCLAEEVFFSLELKSSSRLLTDFNNYLKKIKIIGFGERKIFRNGLVISATSAGIWIGANVPTGSKDVSQAISSGGNVIIPVNCFGLIFELIEAIIPNIPPILDSGRPRITCISAGISETLERSQIYVEWLCDDRADLTLIPTPPLIFSDLMANNTVHAHKTFSTSLTNDSTRSQILDDLRGGTGSVILCNHPSIQFGDVLNFIELWKHDTKSTLIAVEPEHCGESVDAAINALRNPLDFELTLSELVDILSKLKRIDTLIFPNDYKQEIVEVIRRQGCISSLSKCHFRFYGSVDERINVFSETERFIHVEIDKSLSSTISIYPIHAANLMNKIICGGYVKGQLVINDESKSLPWKLISCKGNKRTVPTALHFPRSALCNLSAARLGKAIQARLKDEHLLLNCIVCRVLNEEVVIGNKEDGVNECSVTVSEGRIHVQCNDRVCRRSIMEIISQLTIETINVKKEPKAIA
ncbi:hypothetical protein ACOME3_002126 [Neoechinorhynchus agilis]